MVQEYLGSGVFVEVDGWPLKLEFPSHPYDTISLEKAVYEKLVEYVERMKKEERGA